MGQLIKISKEQHAKLGQIMNAEEEACTGTCRETTAFKPYHFSCFLTTKDGKSFIYNNSCESNGRHYNPVTGEFEGRDHCTCDTCF